MCVCVCMLINYCSYILYVYMRDEVFIVYTVVLAGYISSGKGAFEILFYFMVSVRFASIWVWRKGGGKIECSKQLAL